MKSCLGVTFCLFGSFFLVVRCYSYQLNHFLQFVIVRSFTMPSFNSALAGFSAFLSLFSSVSAAANPLIQIKEPFGPNPTNVSFYLYIPKTIAPNPPILVNPHWCHGTAQDAFAGTQLATLADTYGYIMIFPSSPNAADQCWDVSSKQTLSHNGGGSRKRMGRRCIWMLRWRRVWSLERRLRDGEDHQDRRGVEGHCRSRVSRLQWMETKDASLPWNGR